MKDKNLGIDIVLHSRIKSLSIRTGLPLCELVKFGIDMLEKSIPETISIRKKMISSISNKDTSQEAAGMSYSKTGWPSRPIEAKSYKIQTED